jgi:hypothetical protein
VPATSSGAGLILTLNNTDVGSSSQSPILNQYADMIVLSPTPSPGLDIEKEMEYIRRMKEGGGIYESPKNLRNSLDFEGKNEVQIIAIEDDD